MYYIIILISGYAISSFLAARYMYGNKRATTENTGWWNKHVAIVLGTENINILQHRLKKGREISTKNALCPIFITGKTNTLQHKNFIFSTNTLEDIWVVSRFTEDTAIHIITSANHGRRAYNTCKRLHPNRIIILHNTNDRWRKEWPLHPWGWRYILINITKDYRYNIVKK